MKMPLQSGNRGVGPSARSVPWVLLAALLTAAGCPATHRSQVIEQALVVARAEGGPRVVAARALAAAREASERGDPSEAEAWIMGGWLVRGELLDDRALRDGLDRYAPEPFPHVLRAARFVARAGEALEAGKRDLARGLAKEAIDVSMAHGGPTGWTRSRAQILAAVAGSRLPEAGRMAKLRSSLRYPVLGPQGIALRALARLTLAGIHHRAERYKEAIAAYLAVDRQSGYWREARLGLAWCQLRIGQPQRTLKILTLLPGGLSGDPERAVLAAMAAHQLGQTDGARAVVKGAQEGRATWDPASVTLASVLDVVATDADLPRLGEPHDDLTRTIGGRARVRLLAREVLAVRALPSEPAVDAMAAVLEGALVRTIVRELAAEQNRLAAAWRDLELLLPQLK